MFDPLNMPGNYEQEYSSSNSETSIEKPVPSKKHLSDEEIALRIIEMFVSNSRVNSVEDVVEHYFFVLNKLKNRESTQDFSPAPSFDSYAPKPSVDSDEKDMLSEREYLSDEEAEDVKQMFD